MSDPVYKSRNELFYSVESYFIKLNLKGHIFYLICIVLILAILISIFIINVPIMISSPGIIRPINETASLSASIPGRVTKKMFINGDYVKKGDPILYIDSEKYLGKRKSAQKNLCLREKKYQDLINMCNNKPPDILETSKSEYNCFISRLKAYQKNIFNQKHTLNNLMIFLQDSLISEKEYQDKKLEVQDLTADSVIYYNSKMEEWHRQRENILMEINELKDNITELNELVRNSVIVSPIDGYIEDFKKIEENMFLQLNQGICKIIPDTQLIAQIYINPYQIAWIHEGISIKLMLDSYNYQYYGYIETKCDWISNDITNLKNQPVYIAEGKIKNYFYSKHNKRNISLTQGMTFSARIIISEVPLWKLLKSNLQKILFEYTSV